MNATTAASATAPTHTDAGRAADALVALGAERVLMFGSVARGSQCDHSDIDLVAVLPDLDYRSRRAAHERLRAAADAACGGHVDVIVTDRAEWRIQTECVSGSFANAIADDLVVLADCTPPPEQLAATRWNKEQLMPTSNEELAAERLANTAQMTGALHGLLLPSRTELAMADTDPHRQRRTREARLINACTNAHMAIENALKAVGTIVEIEPKLLWAHDVGKIADAVSEAAPADGPGLRELLHSAPELVRAPDYISMWRTVGVYGTPGDGQTAAEVATPEFTAVLVAIAADVAEAAARWLAARGINTPHTEAVTQDARDLREIATHHNLATGDPHPH